MPTLLSKKFIRLKTNRLLPLKPKDFSLYELYSLAKSIKLGATPPPVTIKETQQGFAVVSGEKYLLATILAGKEEIDCVLLKEVHEINYIKTFEELACGQLNPFQEAEFIFNLMEKLNFSQKEMAKALKIAPSTLSNKLRALKLSETQRDKVINKNLNQRQIRALLRLDNSEMREKALDYIINEKLNSSQTESYIEETLTKLTHPYSSP